MLKKILIFLVVLLAGFIFYVNSRPTEFSFSRSGLILAKPEVIFPYLNNFKRGDEWSPWTKVDLNMKKTYSGPEAGVGAAMEFAGNMDVGEGSLQVLREVPNTSVDIELKMTKPFAGISLVQYQLAPDGDGTRFTWSMTGQNNFLSKLINIFIDCEKMMGEQFEKGIQSLKTLAEAQKN